MPIGLPGRPSGGDYNILPGTNQGRQGNWHIYPGGRKVFVPSSGGLTAGGGVAGATDVAAPAPATPPPIIGPGDPVYDAAINALGRTRTTTQTGLIGERTRGLQGYGYTEGPGGTPVFDPSNPFSKAALLKYNYQTQRMGKAQGMAAAGRLYSGAYGQAQRYIGRQQLGAEDQLTRSLTDFLARNTGQMSDADTAYETGAAQALSESTGRARDSPLYG